MYALLLSVLPILSSGSFSSSVPYQESCDFGADRSAQLPASGAELTRIAARAGSLRIEGRPGLTEVRLRGRACASSRRYLDEIQIVATRSNGELSFETRMPEMTGFGDHYARLDLVVEVPQSIALDVHDSSGDAWIRQVGSLRVTDSSGDLEISDVRGSLEVDDSSGDLEIDGVRGDVLLRDSSGDLNVTRIGGDVRVDRDSSGDIDISRVSRSVLVRRDSSGDIDVRSVRGDFVVSSDGSGGIRYSGVDGRVQIPERRRRER